VPWDVARGVTGALPELCGEIGAVKLKIHLMA